ncbi:MAG: biotin/lipoyl-binding protein [Betaproteobacteria bacterium]|nr:biotin/lipoyl-binding protein [Betaproteobacteria bacterium]
MKRLVIANRGEIARRIMRSGRDFGWKVAVISTPEDCDAPVRFEADAVLEVSSFLDAQAIVNAARSWRADLIHPGYGFLSENADFAQLVEDAGIAFVGPTPLNMRAMGGKESAKSFARRCGVPTLEALLSQELKQLAVEKWSEVLTQRGIVAPFLVKASGGGGGRGMRIVENIKDLPDAIARASQEALASFNDPTVFVERYLVAPRHVEIQVFGDGQGGGVFWGERECSLQRRHQKVLEEAPSPVVDTQLREKMGRAAMALVAETKYRGAGTVEFLLSDSGEFFFLEMNTRLQVEHPVTELVYGVDLVRAQFELALGVWPEGFPRPDVFVVPVPRGVAIEARLLAEDPRSGFLPTPGPLVVYREANLPGVRVDSGVVEGGRVNDRFDSMIAKVIAHAATRAAACELLARALEKTTVHGCTTNLPFLTAVAQHADYIEGNVSTAWIGTHVDELNRSLIPEKLIAFFERLDVRRALADALLLRSAQWSHFYPHRSASQVLGDRFAALLPHKVALAQSGLNVGSVAENGGIDVQPGLAPHEYKLSGRGLVDLLRSLDSESLERSTFSLSSMVFRALAGGLTACEVGCTMSRPRAQHIQITVFGETLTLEWPDDSRAQLEFSAQGRDSETFLKAPMAGKVLEVRVADGDTVSEGDLLFVLESMKMQLELRAPRSGVVAGVRVKPGVTLAGPEVLAEIKDQE